MSLKSKLNKAISAVAQGKQSKAEKEEIKRQQALVKEVLYPIFLKNTKNARELIQTCNNFNVGLDAAFYLGIQKEQKRLSEALLTELDLESVMNKDIKGSAEWLLIKALQNEKTATVKGLIEGMAREIQRIVEKDNIELPLKELKTEFL